MFDFEIEGIRLPVPGIIDEIYLQDENYCFRVGPALACYDPDSKAGGLINLLESDPHWLIYVPIGPERFAEKCATVLGAVVEGVSWVVELKPTDYKSH